MQKHSQKFFSTRVYGFSDLRNFFFFFCALFLSMRSICCLHMILHFSLTHLLIHSLIHSLIRHLVLQTYSALIAIMSCELYSISISLIFSFIFFWSWLFGVRFQSKCAHARGRTKRETFSSVYEICIFNKLNRIQKTAESLPPIESLSNFKHK